MPSLACACRNPAKTLAWGWAHAGHRLCDSRECCDRGSIARRAASAKPGPLQQATARFGCVSGFVRSNRPTADAVSTGASGGAQLDAWPQAVCCGLWSRSCRPVPAAAQQRVALPAGRDSASRPVCLQLHLTRSGSGQVPPRGKAARPPAQSGRQGVRPSAELQRRPADS